MFKVFVYSKKTSKKVATIVNVTEVRDNPKDRTIDIYTNEQELIQFDTKTYKTTLYQN